MKKKNCSLQPALQDWAEPVLPYTSPSDLASISLTCKTLYRVSKSVTASRASDACRALEKHPIPFINPVDDQPYSYFIYTPFSISPSSCPLSQSWGAKVGSLQRREMLRLSEIWPVIAEGGSGCDCRDCFEDGINGCPCLVVNGVVGEVMMECGVNCACGVECGNRLTQGGVSVKLEIVKDKVKGWGLFADQFIEKGKFVCEYAGELLTTKEARIRQQKYDQLSSRSKFSSALLVVREHLPSGKACLRVNIDATRAGNVARFINHSCDGGNLSTVLVRSSGALVPRTCFFASRDILEGEELCFKYGDVSINQKGHACFCGSKACLGFLPSEPT